MKPYYIYIISIILCLTSCKNHSEEWEKLQDVETYIEEQPDSALSILQSINSDNLINLKEKAKCFIAFYGNGQELYRPY